jgi:hypothetical protein
MLALLFAACNQSGQKFVKSPIDNLIRDMDSERNFTIILYDMDFEDNLMSDVYKHRYKVITEKDGKPSERITDWMQVSESTFLEHQNNMGMEVASKVDGRLTKVAAPPGYSRYVNNPQYGHWVSSPGGGSFWEFYGQYAFMSSMLGLMSSYINRGAYMDYKANYYGNRPYYGPMVNGRPSYGTLSEHSMRANPDFHSRTGGAQAFKERVNSKVSRSTGRSTSSGSRSVSSGSSVPRKSTPAPRSSGTRRR